VIGAVMLLMLRSLSYGQQLAAATGQIAANAPFLQSIRATVERYRAFSANSGAAIPTAVTPLEACDVEFAYVAERPALLNATFQLDGGEVVGVIGPSGAGKSTLAQLLLGLREPSTGSVRAGGVDLREVDRSWWSSHVAFVAQDALLFTGTVAENIRFFRDGIDVHTPTASLVLRASLAIFGDHPSTNRFPFILGYVVMCLCVYRFVARRLPAVYAAIALLIPALAQTNYYATELRAYALELAFAGLAFLFWQAATEGRRRAFSIPMLFLCLAATVCCHYYAVLILIPFFLAEIARFWTTRRLDLPLCASLVLSPLPLVGFVPAIEAARRGYQAGMWSKPRLSQIPAAYTEMVGNLLLPVLALFLLISLYRSRKTGSFRKTDSFRTPVPLAETVLAGGLALLPLVSVPLSFFAGGFVTRYILLTIAGIAMIVSYGA